MGIFIGEEFEMQKNLVSIVVVSLLVSTAYAAQTSSFGSLWTKLKASPASLTYSVLADSARDNDQQVRGINFYNYLLGSWRFDPKNDIRITPEWFTAYRPTQYYGNGTPNTQTSFSSLEFRYRRSRILTEDEHGVGLQYQLRYGYLNAKDNHDAIISNRLYFSNTLTPSLSLLNYLRYDLWDHNQNKVLQNDTNDITGRFRYYFWPSLSLTDSVGIGAYLRYEYRWFESQSTLAKTSAVQFTPTINWAVDAYNSLALYAFANIATNDDGYALAMPFNQIYKGITYELEYSLSMF